MTPIDLDVRNGDVIRQLLDDGHDVPFYRPIEPLRRARIERWLSGQIDPPVNNVLSNAELAEVLQVVVEDALMSDRRFGFVADAIERLRRPDLGSAAVDAEQEAIPASVDL